MDDGWKTSIWRDKLLLFVAEVRSACPMIPSFWMWNSWCWLSFRIQVPSALGKTSETCWHSKEDFCPKFRQVPVVSLAVEWESDIKLVMWVHTYLTKLAQHVLPGDAHVLQQEVPVVNVLKIHFGTNVSCSYACSRRKHSLLTSTWTFSSPFCVRMGTSKEGHGLCCFFPSMCDLAQGVKQALECLVVVCFHDPLTDGSVLAGIRAEVLMQRCSEQPRLLLISRAWSGYGEDMLNFTSDQKVGVNDNYTLAISLGLVLAIMTRPGPSVLENI